MRGIRALTTAVAAVIAVAGSAACGPDNPSGLPTYTPGPSSSTTLGTPTPQPPIGPSWTATPDPGETTLPASAFPKRMTGGDPRSSVTATTMVVGGAYGGITYDALFDGGTPKNLLIKPGRPLHVTQFFVTIPDFGPDGYPSSGATVMAYQWNAYCRGHDYTLSPVIRRPAPVAPAESLFYPLVPGFTVSATITLPAPCYTGTAADPAGWIGIEFTDPAMASPGLNTTPMLTSAAPSQLQDFDPTIGSDGRPVLYAIGDKGQLASVAKDGSLWNEPAGFIRYFVTNCQAAGQLLAQALEAGRDGAGIIRIPGPSDFAEKAVAGVVSLKGGGEVAVWGGGAGDGCRLGQRHDCGSGVGLSALRGGTRLCRRVLRSDFAVVPPLTCRGGAGPRLRISPTGDQGPPSASAARRLRRP